MISPHVHVPIEKIGAHLELILSHKLNLEIYISAAQSDSLPDEGLQRVRDLLTHSPSLSLHAPFMDLSPGAVDDGVRHVTMDRFRKALAHASLLGAGVVVFHSGFEKWKYAPKPEWWLEKSLLTWEPLIREAEQLGIRIAIENIFEDGPSNLRMLMDRLGGVHFGICFDTGHCNLFSRVPLEEWMESLNPHIIELHLHDNDRTADQHLPVGDGTFDFQRFFSLLRNLDAIPTLEAHSPERVIRSLKNLSNYIK